MRKHLASCRVIMNGSGESGGSSSGGGGGGGRQQQKQQQQQPLIARVLEEDGLGIKMAVFGIF